MSSALYRQVEVFGALLQRETEWRFARRSLGMVEEIASIAVHVATFAFLRVISGAEVHDSMPILPFVTSGVFVYWMLRTGLNNVSAAVFLVSRYSPFACVTPLDTALARGTVNMILYAILGMVSFYVLELFGWSQPMRDPFLVLGMLFYAGIFGMGVGLVASGIFYFAPIMRTVIVTGGMRILALISGTYFVIPDVPPSLRPYAVWNPLLHMNDMMRAAYFATYNADQADPNFVAICVIGVVCAGLIIERALRPISSTRLG
jgi:capsular polysaccharide transport system permease protein